MARPATKGGHVQHTVAKQDVSPLRLTPRLQRLFVRKLLSMSARPRMIATGMGVDRVRVRGRRRELPQGNEPSLGENALRVFRDRALWRAPCGLIRGSRAGRQLNGPAAGKQRDECKHQKDEEQNLGNTHGARRNTGEAEDSGNKRDDEKYRGPIKHDDDLLIGLSLQATGLPRIRSPVESTTATRPPARQMSPC
jgi:hypothetical protein